jgi:hypothetical protein
MGLLLSLTLLFLLAGCSPLKESAAQDINKVSNLEMESQDKVLSKDYLKAEKALVKAIQAEDKKTIRLGLKNEILLIKKKAVTALGEIKDKQSVPDLIEVLSENQVMMGGGSEMAAMQAELNTATVLSLSRLTGLKFDVSEVLSSDDIAKVLEESRKWWNINRNNDK